MQIPFVANGHGWTFFLDNKPVSVSSDNIRYGEITQALTTGDEAALRKLLRQSDEEFVISKIKEETETFGDLEFKIITRPDAADEHSVLYKGRKLSECLTKKLFSLWRAGCKDFTHYFAFIEKLSKNPSHRAQQELYRFLSYAELPINMEGNFIAYKGVDEKYWSINGNTNTRVLKGKVLSGGHILNTPGSLIQVEVADVDDDCNNYCSCGLHVGSYNYATGFAQGHVMAVEVDPRYVVSVPRDCDGQKCRVSQYRVLNEVTSEYSNADVETDESGNVRGIEREERPNEHPGLTALMSPDNISNTRESIERNIESHDVYVYETAGVDVVPTDPSARASKRYRKHATTISQLCASVGRKHNVPRGAMLTLLLRLGYNVQVDNNALGNSIVTC